MIEGVIVKDTGTHWELQLEDARGPYVSIDKELHAHWRQEDIDERLLTPAKAALKSWVERFHREK